MNKLSEFIKEQLKGGADISELKNHLIKNGWNEQDVTSAINSNFERRTRNRVFLSIVGVLLICVLAFVLISFAKTDSPEIKISSNTYSNNIGEMKSDDFVDECSNKESSIEKDECYKTLLNKGFNCDVLVIQIEKTYCSRANEDLLLKGVERIEEN